MKTAYFDCFSGAAGDMIVGALLDAGLDLEALREKLSGLGLAGYDISAEKVRRGGIAGTKFTVSVTEQDQRRRGLDDILAIIGGANLPARAAEIAVAVFRRLAEAEARVHGVAVRQVHFHEVGAIDSIVDIVAAAAGIVLLGIERVCCSPIPTGRGTIQTQHGPLPLPAPATAELLKTAVTAGLAGAGEIRPDPAGELTTPTGAAVLTTLSDSYGHMPAMKLQAVGYGAGSSEAADRREMPDLLRVFIGLSADDDTADSVMELSANLDDCTGEVLGAAIEKLLQAGCVDAWATPIYMKSSRPAWMLSALCAPAEVRFIEEIIFAETTTLGVRRRPGRRSKLARRHVTVETAYGPVRVKIGSLAGPGQGDSAGSTLTASPEFADCLAAAEAHGVPVKEVIAAAVQAHRGQRAAGQKPQAGDRRMGN